MKRLLALLVLLVMVTSCTYAFGEEVEPYIARIDVVGEIADYGDSYYSYGGYDHSRTLNAIESLIYDEDNVSLFVYFNTPGGYLYESEELYQKIMRYKKETSRPVYAYAAAQMCSGGLYAAMAADYIVAGRMSEVGSIGIIYSTQSMSGLYDMLGIEVNNITTGEFKMEGVPTLTDSQRELIDGRMQEYLSYFVEVVALGRSIPEDEVRAFSDGRVFTAKQSLEIGLIDSILTYDEAIDDMDERYATADYPMYTVNGWSSEMDGMGEEDSELNDIFSFLKPAEDQSGDDDANRKGDPDQATPTSDPFEDLDAGSLFNDLFGVLHLNHLTGRMLSIR